MIRTKYVGPQRGQRLAFFMEQDAYRRMTKLCLESSYLYQRVMLNFRVDQNVLESRLPPGWRVEDRLGGSTLTVGFCDVLEHVDAGRRPIATPTYRYVPFNGTARGPAGLNANWRYMTYSDRPQDSEKCLTKSARSSRSYRLTSRDGSIVVEEFYEFALERGGVMMVRVEYERGVPRHYRYPGDGMHVRCPAEPEIEYVYRNEEWRDLILYRESRIDRVRTLDYQISVAEFNDLFDGSEQLVSVIAVPWSYRQVFSVT